VFWEGSMAYVPMVVASIRINPANDQRVLVLKEASGERYLPMWVGPAEADSIAVKTQGIFVPRPMTHDFICDVINSIGGKVESVKISELKEDTFYSKLVLEVSGRRAEVDCRPSDAIGVAVRLGVPILVLDDILTSAGAVPEENTSPVPQKKAVRLSSEAQRRQWRDTRQLLIQEYIDMAGEETRRLKSTFLTTGHILLSLEQLKKGKRYPQTWDALSKYLHLDMSKLKSEIEASIRQGEEPELEQQGVSAAFESALRQSFDESLLHPLGSQRLVRPEHVLLGLLSERTGIAAHLLNDSGIGVEKVLRFIITMYFMGFYK
jgi:bifunctional DNase/RNase